MRVERTSQPQPSKPKQPFPKVPARPVTSNAIASRGAAHATTAQALQRARAGHVVTAGELQRARAGHAVEAHRPPVDQPPPRFPRGARERLIQALEQGPTPQQPLAPGPERAEATAPTSNASSALELVERIQVFLRSGRPQLELSVGGAFQAEVLLERTGPREVAVMVRGKNGPPPPQELARLREELQRRGLKLSSLSITSSAATRPPSSPAARG